ncbi:MAG TPA: fumarylacetoacetate hydrolase family protein [Burkholderiales bacterium]|nr:fumarylacetoacetate hydrolase family protein [Burkholderiales bacterium]
MKLVTFSTAINSNLRVGVLVENTNVLDLSAEADNMLSLIESGRKGLQSVESFRQRNDGGGIPLSEVLLRAPIPRPRKNVFCVGWNYLEHYAEGERIRKSGEDLPKYPVFFSKAVTAVSGPFDDIPYDANVSTKMDWEVELGVIIGKAGKNISEKRAFDHVFGYTVINDVSAREVQKRHGGQWLKGKSLDGCCPMGPCLVTADEIDPSNLRVITRVNGVTKQDSNTRHLYFKIPRLIAELSLGMTLEPGDIISTGTPEGVGFARNPPEYLQPGDVMETEIVGIGVMRNVVAVA